MRPVYILTKKMHMIQYYIILNWFNISTPFTFWSTSIWWHFTFPYFGIFLISSLPHYFFISRVNNKNNGIKWNVWKILTRAARSFQQQQRIRKRKRIINDVINFGTKKKDSLERERTFGWLLKKNIMLEKETLRLSLDNYCIV